MSNTTKSHTVLSLFDGMSCGQIALDQLGIEVGKYYSSEIDKWAIQVTQKNYPDTIQLGDITKWREWDIDWASIDLIYGGSPCQGFSFAGKQLAFDDPRSKLFFDFVDIVNHIKEANPDVKFLLENVRMKKEYLDVISEYMGVQPVKINSALVSAQNRVRFYWTNIGEIEQPEDRGILLKDIIEDGDVDREKSYCIDANYFKGGSLKNYLEKKRRQVVLSQSESRLMATRSNCLTSANYEYGIVQENPRVKNITENDRGYRPNQGDYKSSGISELGRVLKSNAKTDALTTSHAPKMAQNNDINNLMWRKLTPLECERLQTVPDNFTNHVSNTQRYRMLGNGWTVEVIKWIFMKFEESNNV